ncbi:hypothetical protein [Tenacibaculum sp. 190524A02b]|uniref:hypothetical protein n=1 Tax=Tenacibaculum vairaonense TaxID=3137860 RepID=UPI0031FA78B7
MKVKFEFDVEEIVYINELLNKLYSFAFNSFSCVEKIEISIGYELSDLFDKKRRIITQRGITTNGLKKYKISLKYYQAWALKQILRNYLYLLENDYQKLKIEKSISHLDLETVEDVNILEQH